MCVFLCVSVCIAQIPNYIKLSFDTSQVNLRVSCICYTCNKLMGSCDYYYWMFNPPNLIRGYFACLA